MSDVKEGERVGALLSSESDTVYVIGYGVYAGREVPEPGAVGELTRMLRDIQADTPKIVLDDGRTVYGCQCWWGPEDVVKARVAKFARVVQVNDLATYLADRPSEG